MFSLYFALISIVACSPFGYRAYGTDPYSMGGLGMSGTYGMGSPYGMMGSPYGMGGLGMGGYGMGGMGGIPPPMPPPGLGMGTFGSPYSSLGSPLGVGGLSPFLKK